MDDEFLAKYREARISERVSGVWGVVSTREDVAFHRLKEAKKLDRFGSVFIIEKADWTREINEVSKSAWVFVHLFQEYVSDCVALNTVMDSLSAKYPTVKFVKIRATSAVETWPDSNLPAVYLYHDGEMQHQLIGSRAISEGPPPFTANSVARKLASLKIISPNSEMPNQPPPPPEAPTKTANVRRSAYSGDDDATWDA